MMSIHDLRTRLADVPGIQNLSMALEAGKIMLRWGEGYAATADVSASDADLEEAVRHATRLPPVMILPDKQAQAAVPAPIGAAPMSAPSAPAPSTGSAASAVQQLMAEHVALTREIHAASLETLRVSLARQRDAMSGAVSNVAAKVDAQTDDFLSMMGQFTNDL